MARYCRLGRREVSPRQRNLTAAISALVLSLSYPRGVGFCDTCIHEASALNGAIRTLGVIGCYRIYHWVSPPLGSTKFPNTSGVAHSRYTDLGKGNESRKLLLWVFFRLYKTLDETEKMGDARSVVIITSRNSIAREATDIRTISTAYNAPYNTLSSG